MNMKKNLAEFLGTFWLVLGGCGTALLATNTGLFGDHNVGFIGVALAFGLTVLTGVYAFGPISGGHFNPAVTLGMWAGGKCKGEDVLPYIASQILGAIAAAAVLCIIVTGNGAEIGDFAANGYGAHSPGGYGMGAALVCEFFMTCMFLLVILGATDKRAPAGFAGIAIGLSLTLIHLVSIPVTNTSVNPARSISQALFVGGWAVQQLWLFIVAPIAGGMFAGVIYKYLLASKDTDVE